MKSCLFHKISFFAHSHNTDAERDFHLSNTGYGIRRTEAQTGFRPACSFPEEQTFDVSAIAMRNSSLHHSNRVLETWKYLSHASKPLKVCC